jgi:hypothetical protein
VRRRVSVVLAIAFAGLIVSGIGQAQGTQPVISSGPDLWTQETTATFVFSGDSDDTFQCRVDGPDWQDWTDCASPWDYPNPPLAQGAYTFRVRTAVDQVVSATYEWTIDTTPPELPNDVVVEAVSPAGASVHFEASDNLDPIPKLLSCTPGSDSTFALGVTTVENCVATDAALNQKTGEFDVKVVDTTAPVLDQRDDVADVHQESPQGAVVNYARPDAHDAVDPSPHVSCSPDSGSTFPIGSTPVTCKATDNSGNESDETHFFVLVQKGDIPDEPTLTPHVPQLTNKTSAKFEFSADSGVDLDCRLKGPGATDTFGPCTTDSSQTYTGLQEGAYGFTVQATNGIGNISQKSYSWTIDRTKPAAVAKFRAIARDKVVRLEWKRPIDVDYDHVRILRKRAGTEFWKTIATRDSATALKDTAVQNDVRYRYRIQSVDQAHNPSAGAEVNGRPSKMYSPVFGAIRRSPPLIDWTPVRNATYYNVQVWRNGHKVLSRWPLRSSTRLRSSWAFAGRTFSFTSGHYVVYAWPGFGRKASARYGGLLGWTAFEVR